MAQHNFNDYKLLVGQMAMKGYKRLLANNVSVDYDDVFQQMSLTFVMASNKFDASKGYEFSTYMVRACWLEFNKWAEGQINYRQNIMSAEELRVGDDSDFAESVFEMFPNGGMTPEQEAEINHDNIRTLRNLSRQAKTVVSQLIQPSQKVEAEWSAHKKRILEGRANGTSSRRVPEDMSITFLMDQANVPPRRRSDVRRELSVAFGVSV